MIEQVSRLSSYPAASYTLLVSGGDTDRLRTELAAEAVAQRVDIAVEPSSLYRRARRLVVMDVDSTLVQGESDPLGAPSLHQVIVNDGYAHGRISQ